MLEAIQHDIWVFAFESSEWPFSAMAQDHRRSEPSLFFRACEIGSPVCFIRKDIKCEFALSEANGPSQLGVSFAIAQQVSVDDRFFPWVCFKTRKQEMRSKSLPK